MLTGAVPRWMTGDLLAIVWGEGLALVDVPLTVAERIWARVNRDPKLGTFLKTLAETADSGFLDLPKFAIAMADGHRWHLAVRGAITVEAQLADRVELLSGEGITTWAERVIPPPEALRLGVCSGTGGPIRDGVVMAGGLTIGEFRPDQPPEPMAEPQDEDRQVDPPADRDESEALPAIVPAPQPVHAHTDEAFAAAQETLAEDEHVADPGSEELAPPVAVPEPPISSKYASLWDHSIALDVAAAAIRSEEDDESSKAPVTQEGHPAATELSVPRRLPAEVVAAQLSGDTVVDEGQVAIQMGPSEAGPEVLARFCDRGHPNPPERVSCYVCGSEVAGEARNTKRPQLGWLRVEGGETVPLRGPIIAGRNPRSNLLNLTETPRLLALPHPHVSGTHLAILIEGWRLMARDLRSRNGTYLRRHGKPPVRLPDTSVPLVPGDLIDLGHGLFLHLDRTP